VRQLSPEMISNLSGSCYPKWCHRVKQWTKIAKEESADRPGMPTAEQTDMMIVASAHPVCLFKPPSRTIPGNRNRTDRLAHNCAYMCPAINNVHANPPPLYHNSTPTLHQPSLPGVRCFLPTGAASDHSITYAMLPS